MAEAPLAEKVVTIDTALSEARMSHAFGGALAAAYYAEPRATIDIDINIFAPTERIEEVNFALEPSGVVPLTSAADQADLERDGQCRLWWGNTALDLFFSYDEVHEAMREGTRRVPFGEEELDILGPEHLVVCKARFDRTKDWIDIEQILVASEHFDVGEVDRWLERFLGDRDPRKQRFDELAAELRD